LTAKNIDLKYKLFDRLNTGGAPATAQEVRNAIYRGEKSSPAFFKVLEKCSKDAKFLGILNFDEDRLNKLYNQELVLSFFALYENKEKLQGNIKDILDTYISNCVKSDRDFTDLESLFKNVIKLIADNSLNFKYYRNYNGKNREMAFSSSYFDAIMVGLAVNLDYYTSQPKLVHTIVDNLKKDEVFKKSATGQLASSEDRIKKRIEQAIKFFKQ
jgi:hypothetical protein